MKMKISRLIRNAGVLCIGLMSLPVSTSASSDIVSNEKPDAAKINRARRIIAALQHELEDLSERGNGPFLASIYDAEGNLVAKMPNTVALDKCSHNHAEMNAIRVAEEKLGTYDLGPFNLKLYTTSEPCSMCMGGIMWSGIREVYYGVPSESVERITGFDEGFKPGWLEEFKKRGITVYGNIERELASRRLEIIWKRAEQSISRSGKAEAAESAGIFTVVYMLVAVYV